MELSEELSVSITDASEVRRIAPFTSIDCNVPRTWIVYPLHIAFATMPVVRLNWENSDYRWVNATEFRLFDVLHGQRRLLAAALCGGVAD